MKHSVRSTSRVCARSESFRPAESGIRQHYAAHISATERRFYDEREAGIEDVVDWCARLCLAKTRPVRKLLICQR
jgi:hypothetical protein